MCFQHVIRNADQIWLDLIVRDPIVILHTARQCLLHEIWYRVTRLVQKEALEHVVVALEQRFAAVDITAAPALEQFAVGEIHAGILARPPPQWSDAIMRWATLK